MEVVTTVKEVRALLEAPRRQGKSIGMVGTSGAMHEGHLSLISRSAAENDVNVLYWGGTKSSPDWKKVSFGYERDPNRDFPLAEAAGAQIIWAPPGGEMYPRRPMTKVSLPDMSIAVPHLEDPKHLDSISLAMCKLWNVIAPSRVYFGEKDWQQLALFQRLADDLNFPIEVLGCPTIRDDDGLAKSSRNSQLTPEQRKIAPVFYRALCAARDAAHAGKARNAAELENVFAGAIGDAGKIRYFTPVRGDTMELVDTLTGQVRVLASLQLGEVRLLDNIGLELPG